MDNSQMFEQNNEQLLKARKSLKVITAMLAGAILLLFLVSLYNLKTGYGLVAVPLALSTIVMLNTVNIKEISRELYIRILD